MLKLLIVDDEEKVCQLIEYIIDWHSYGIEIIGVANDGQTAYELIAQDTPDIIITDIRMPMYNGIELIKKTRELNINVSFIIISGYSQFEYAKSAIQYGVANYLLKPIQKKELVATIERILKKYELKSEFENSQKELIKKIEKNQKRTRSNLIRDYIINNTIAESDESITDPIESINDRYSCHFKKGNFAFIIIRPFLSVDRNDKKLWDLLISKIKANAEERLENNTIEKVSMVNEREIFYFINTDNDSIKRVKKSLQGIVMDSLSLTKIFGDIHTLIGISSIVQDQFNIRDLYFQAECALLNRFLVNDNLLKYTIGDVEAESGSFLDRKKRNQIISSFESHNQAEVLDLINSVYYMVKKKGLKGIDILNCYKEMINCISFSINTYMSSTNFPEENELMDRFRETYSLETIFKDTKDLINATFFNLKESESKPIRMAKDYIYQNYNSNLCLGTISKDLGFNSSYFSSLFKKETGENFMDFVIKVRMGYAKQFLEQTDLDIIDIAEKVGYSDLKYFSKIFKRNIHLTPLEYRKVYG